MLFGSASNSKPSSLMDEYASLLSDAVLRHRARVAEHSARVEAELASKVKSEFIANMSHELKTPLNTVLGFSKLLARHQDKRLPDKEIVEYAALINSAAAQLLSMINNILDISKLQSGKFALETKIVDLETILNDTVAPHTLGETGINIVSEISPDLPLVLGDAAKLKQIFANVLSNALRFTPVDGSVTINATATAEGGARVVISDTGVGMSEDEIQISLVPFGVVDGSRTRRREGTGLGLPIAHALVALHGGSLQIRSQKGSGTDIIIVLPPRDKVVLPTLATVAGLQDMAT